MRQLDVAGHNRGTDSELISELEAVRRANKLIVQLAEANTRISQLEGQVVKLKDRLSEEIILPPLTSSISDKTPSMPCYTLVSLLGLDLALTQVFQW